MMSEKLWTIGTILTWTKQYFGEKGVENPRLDAEVLLSHILGKDRLYLYVNFDQPLVPEELATFRQVVIQRARRIPVAYITGKKEFMGLTFAVSPDVLIPRPDTEILVETALKLLKTVACPTVLDIGTGSGAIVISLLQRMASAQGVGVDISPQALEMAKKNAELLQVDNRLTFFEGNLFEQVAAKTFTIIVSNPPYITKAELDDLTPEVKWEPRIALDGGADGLDFYRALIAGSATLLEEQGFLVLEVGAGQAGLVAALADEASGLKCQALIKDYGSIERVVVLERR
jgi:release factor glutamine methyltransferase